MRKLLAFLSVLACVALVEACGADSQLPTGASSPAPALSGTAPTPTFLTLEAGAPSLAATTVSFWAVKGQKREAFIWYHPSPGETDSTKLVRLRVEKNSLCNRPNGTPIANGDSILITMTVVDAATQKVQFQPYGLLFCTGNPAKLQMWYEEIDHDFDDDGDVDAADASIEAILSIWKQESSTAPWVKQTSVVELDEDEVEADITGFTNYLIAY